MRATYERMTRGKSDAEKAEIRRRGFVRNSTKVVAMVVIEGDPITVAAVTVAGVAVVNRAYWRLA